MDEECLYCCGHGLQNPLEHVDQSLVIIGQVLVLALGAHGGRQAVVEEDEEHSTVEEEPLPVIRVALQAGLVLVEESLDTNESDKTRADCQKVDECVHNFPNDLQSLIICFIFVVLSGDHEDDELEDGDEKDNAAGRHAAGGVGPVCPGQGRAQVVSLVDPLLRRVVTDTVDVMSYFQLCHGVDVVPGVVEKYATHD